MPRPEPATGRRRRRRLFVALGLVILILTPAAFVAAECALTRTVGRDDALADSPVVQQAKGRVSAYTRPAGSTYFTLPEWIIVYDAEEYAAFVHRARPSGFPYLRLIGQYWSYYRGVCHVACAAYPFDLGDHVMLATIGTSFSVENLIKGVYENTIGRVSEWVAGTDTDEDRLAAVIATEYAHFMHGVPWYDFPFGQAFHRLWSETSLWGPHFIRKWERKMAMSLEYGIKAVYGALIRVATKSAYGDEVQWVQARIENLAPDSRDERIRLVSTIGDGSAIFSLKRYEPFTALVVDLAARGARFRDIAGNRRIVMTVLADDGSWPTFDKGAARVLFSKRELTSTRQRLVIEVQVEALSNVVNQLQHDRTVRLEHIYDH